MDITTRRLILVRGLPGSGKTTIAKAIVDGFYHGDPPQDAMCAADDFFYKDGKYVFDAYTSASRSLTTAHADCQRRAFGAMSDGTPLVVVHNTFTTMWEMTPYLAIAKLHGYTIQVIECKGSFGSVHNVPDEVMDLMAERWEEYNNE